MKWNDLAVPAGVALLSVTLAFVGTHYFAPLVLAENTVADFRTATMLPSEPQDPDVVIAAVTEDTLSNFSYRSPVDRAFLAGLLRALEQRHPKAIALDVLFDQPTEPEKDALLKQTIESLSVPLAISYVDKTGIVDEDQLAYENDFVPARLRVYADQQTSEGIARKLYPGKRANDGTFIPGFAYGVAQKAGVAAAPIGDEANMSTWDDIAWRGVPTAVDTAIAEYPAHAVAILPPVLFENKVVLVGEIVSLTDRFPTPFATAYSGSKGDWAGVEIQAQGVSQVMHGRHSRKMTRGPEWTLMICLALAGVTFGKMNLGMARQLAVSGGTMALLWPAGFAIFHYFGLMMPLVEPSLAFVVATWGTDALTGREAKRQREFINGAFARYLNPSLVKQLANDPSKLQLGGEMRPMTILFCDIRGFTTISEKFDAHGLTRFINRFLTPMTDLIMAGGGTIDKYMGDCIMAFWNAPLDDPDHAEHGCRSALAMRARLAELNAQWRAEAEAAGTAPIVVNIGIGLNSGVCCVGNVGSDQRFDYSVLGDDVNLASRLEGQSKTYHLDIVIGERTAEAVPMLAILELDSIRVKGKTKPVLVYSLLGDDTLLADPAFLTLKESHDAMLAAYRRQAWSEARAHLDACRQKTMPLMAGFYDVYEERIADYEASPPGAAWDGVYVALTK